MTAAFAYQNTPRSITHYTFHNSNSWTVVGVRVCIQMVRAAEPFAS